MLDCCVSERNAAPLAVHWERLSLYSRCQAVLESVRVRHSSFCLLPLGGRNGTRCFPAAHVVHRCEVASTLLFSFGILEIPIASAVVFLELPLHAKF